MCPRQVHPPGHVLTHVLGQAMKCVGFDNCAYAMFAPSTSVAARQVRNERLMVTSQRFG